MPKISIILPIFKTEDYLRRCIDSIINQTLTDIEVILATDGPDECDKICKEYAAQDNRIKIVMHPGSYGKAFNKSLEIAQGEYIGIVETDDWCDLQMYEKLYNRAKECDAEVVKAGFYFAYNDINKNHVLIYENFEQEINLNKNSSFLASQPSVWSCIYKKDFLKNNKIVMVEDRMPFIDVPFHYETLYKASKYQLLKEPLYYYYQDNPNQTIKSVKPFDGLNSEKYAYSLIAKENGLFDKYKEGFAFATACHLHWNYSNLKKEDIKPFWTATHEFLATLSLSDIKYIYFHQEAKVFFINILNFTYNDIEKQIFKRNMEKIIKKIIQSVFSIKKEDSRKVWTILGVKLKFKDKRIEKLENKLNQSNNELNNRFNEKIQFQNTKIELQKVEIELQKEKIEKLYNLKSDISNLKEELFYSHLNNLESDISIIKKQIDNQFTAICNIDFENSELQTLKYIFPNANIEFYSKNCNVPDHAFLWSTRLWPGSHHYETIKIASDFNKNVVVFEDGFLKSVASPQDRTIDLNYRLTTSYTINSHVLYCDSTKVSELENLLSDKNIVITEEQTRRARKCIDKILKTHLTKYNHQPIYTPKIGREGVKKILVVDQSYGDVSIVKGLANSKTFNDMLNCAIRENPDADIIVKTHPDTIAKRDNVAHGYYSNLQPHDNIYTMTEQINPISLIKYCDKVYVCTSQMGFEALMCGKEVHTFGIGFYAGWGLTIDYQTCERRTTKRTLEEMFYITYIMYSYYVNPIKKCRCEIEEAMDYLLKLRDEYFNEYKIRNDRKVLTNE